MERAWLGYSLARSTLYTLESLMIPLADAVATRKIPRLPFQNLALFLRIRKSLHALLLSDVQRMERGIYPASVFLPEWHDSFSHFARIPKLFREAVDSSRRRKKKQTKSFEKTAKKILKEMPEYYRRNFHFQKDGYLSEESASFYDHQVELLFAGAADPMRRMVIEPLKLAFPGDGEGLHFLELGCGVGSSTRFMQMAFPKAQITAIDLSEPYLQKAISRLPSVNFREERAERLSFRGKTFDAVYSVFLFHELPLNIRKLVLKEAKRVLKPGGVFSFVDSLQLGDVSGFEEPLLRFPREFHEPFFPNYLRNPMEGLMDWAGFQKIETKFGFFSKVCAGRVGKR